MTPVCVFNYSDYRVFLKDAVREKLKRQPQLSMRSLAKRAGFSSPGYLQMVIRRQRNLSETSIKRVTGLLSLAGGEEKFFAMLVAYNHARSIGKKKELIAEMFSLANQIQPRVPVRILGIDLAWYNFVLLELATCRGFTLSAQSAYQALQKKVSVAEIAQALSFLRSQGFLTEEGGSFRLGAAQQVRTPDEMLNLNIQAIHRQALRNAEAALALPVAEREFQSITMALSEAGLARLKRRLKDVCTEVAADFANDPDASQVFQINFQAFPVTQITKT